jgi:hypothetical protein
VAASYLFNGPRTTHEPVERVSAGTAITSDRSERAGAPSTWVAALGQRIVKIVGLPAGRDGNR